MNERVLNALRQSRYRVMTDDRDLDDIYRLRYDCYRAEGSIAANAQGIMHDAYDDTANCLHIAVETNGKLLAAVRLHLMSELSAVSPTAEVFPEITSGFGQGRTVLDPTRFVIDPSARKQRVSLHFLVLRIPFMAALFYDVDLALAPVRSEHMAFYRRYLGYAPMLDPRSYPGLAKPIHLLTTNVREQRAAVLSRTPVFGPIADMPQSDIAFPDLAGVYVPSQDRRTAAA
ncbi:Acetyltransferase (GNAT) domain-containing protein [Loktanella sp. DSM 29012]|nr:Acetyltransferase (GNAT) domain-containing protein [Loktanella sp. DSM 29012]